MVLDQISTLKKLLKVEVEQRKNAETQFRDQIQKKSEQILNKFTVEYLNKLNQMSDQVTSFTQRKKALDGNMQQLQRKVEVDLR